MINPPKKTMTNLRKARTLALLTPAELAGLAGVTPELVRQQERIGIRTARVAVRYAEVLKCNPLTLLEVAG